jgi:hypothetical protein
MAAEEKRSVRHGLLLRYVRAEIQQVGRAAGCLQYASCALYYSGTRSAFCVLQLHRCTDGCRRLIVREKE